MREVTTAEAKSTPVPASAAPRAMDSTKLGASEQGSPTAEIGGRGKNVKPKKSAVFLGKLGKAFGVKKRDKEVPPMPVAA
jgi:hypothetical protein